MQYIKSVTMLDDHTSHWVMKGPLGADIEWDAVTMRMDENERVAWNSKDNSAVTTSGQVIASHIGNHVCGSSESTLKLRPTQAMQMYSKASSPRAIRFATVPPCGAAARIAVRGSVVTSRRASSMLTNAASG